MRCAVTTANPPAMSISAIPTTARPALRSEANRFPCLASLSIRAFQVGTEDAPVVEVIGGSTHSWRGAVGANIQESRQFGHAGPRIDNRRLLLEQTSRTLRRRRRCGGRRLPRLDRQGNVRPMGASICSSSIASATSGESNHRETIDVSERYRAIADDVDESRHAVRRRMDHLDRGRCKGDALVRALPPRQADAPRIQRRLLCSAAAARSASSRADRSAASGIA